jgi:hypothetical protein
MNGSILIKPGRAPSKKQELLCEGRAALVLSLISILLGDTYTLLAVAHSRMGGCRLSYITMPTS